MNWIFFDALPWDYDVTTPLTRPLGGSQSAMCYLATALARRGHQVTTVTGIANPRTVSGVTCISYNSVPPSLFAPAGTLAIVLNGPAEAASHLRSVIPRSRRLILWTQHAPNQPAMRGLADPTCVALWDRIVCVSDWHKSVTHEHLAVPLEKIDVLRNAFAPPFEHLFDDRQSLANSKSAALRLAYTSTPFRGLDVLLSCFPEIHHRHPTCRLDVYSSMQVYGDSPDQDAYQQLYAQCRATSGVNYHGSLPQPALAKELAGVSLLAYPNTFGETSCIAVMEALAAGALVVTSDLAALPETCGGWARLVPPVSRTRTKEQFELDFINAVDQELIDLQTHRESFLDRRLAQVTAMNAECNWDIRAAEWEAIAARWMSQHG